LSRRPAPRLRAAFAVAVLLLAGVHPPLAAQSAGEGSIKAAYLIKLASFVRWPADAGGDTFRICVSGRADIARVLGRAVGEQRVEGRRVALVQLGAGNPQQARTCQILFLGSGGEPARSLLDASRGAPVLTVTDGDNGTRGGAVEFVIRDGRVRFTIDRSEAESRQLELSSKLLDVALAVEP